MICHINNSPSKPFIFPWEHIPKSGMAAFADKCSKMLSRLLHEGKLVPAPIKINEYGLASVQEGFLYMKSGKVRFPSRNINTGRC